MSDILRFSVPGKPEYVSMIRLAVSSAANTAGFNIEEIDDIKIAVSEACTNVVCHGQLNENDVYEVICNIGENEFFISVEDKAGGYDVDEYKKPSIDELKPGGMGLYIIQALMDKVDIVSQVGQGTKIEMIKYLTNVES
jgi:Anti-sigma regulatory factor (Ser/Thr protein kinase)